MARVRDEMAAKTPNDDRPTARRPVGLSDLETRQCRSLLQTMSTLVEAAGRTTDPFEQVAFWESYLELQLQLDMIIPFQTCLTPAA
jgi:hypothetical protein